MILRQRNTRVEEDGFGEPEPVKPASAPAFWEADSPPVTAVPVKHATAFPAAALGVSRSPVGLRGMGDGS